MEAIWVAAEMCAGAAYAHATLAMEEMDNFSERRKWLNVPIGLND